jgi:hypothetical protein
MNKLEGTLEKRDDGFHFTPKDGQNSAALFDSINDASGRTPRIDVSVDFGPAASKDREGSYESRRT